jgi:hypothetical protein
MISTGLKVRWSVAMRRFLLAAVISGVAAGAQAADMHDLPILRGGFTEGPAAATVNWQGYYIGGQGSYGTITSKLHSGSNSGLQSAFVPPAWQPSGQQLNGENGGGGAFAGYNSQWDDVVVGIEANYLHGGLRASSNSPGVTVVNNITAVTNSNLTVQVSPTSLDDSCLIYLAAPGLVARRSKAAFRLILRWLRGTPTRRN